MKILKSVPYLSAVVLSFFSMSVTAQDEYSKLLTEDIAESKVLIGEYISPFMKSVSLGLNQGWYNTAKTHKLLGVDITTSISFMTIPDSETSFNVPKLNLSSYELAQNSPGYPNAPTVFGSDKQPRFNYTDPNNQTYSFDGPAGIGLKDKIKKNVMPVPMAQIGIGLPKGTDLKIRFVPTIDLNGDGEFKLFGVGVMHDIKQHIPGIKLLPFDLAAFAGHTQMSIEYRPDVPAEDRLNGENQRGEFKISATTIQAVISKKISVLTVYGGLGYNVAKSSLGIKGTYDINDDGDVTDLHERDPLTLDYSASGPRASAGLRLKLAVFTLHADYSFQKYKAFTAGFGISVR